MKWLFWKEYRQNRVTVIALLVMLIIPYLFALWVTWWENTRRPHPIVNALQQSFVVASFYSLAISQIALALIGGNAIAGERADRSAEFQAYLPITRKKILAGKLLMALAVAAAIWLIIPSIGLGFFCSIDNPIPRDVVSMIGLIIVNIAVTGFMFFCVAWLFSSILSSPTFSTVAGLVAPVIIWSLILYVNYFIQGNKWAPGTGKILQNCYWGISLTIAVACFGLGTCLYLRRVEP